MPDTPQPDTPPPEGSLASDFAAGLGAVLGRSLNEGERLGIAVSGGPDSMALLDLAAMHAPGRVEAATVDHGLRAESVQEAVMVAQWCAAQAIPHATLRPATPISGSLQAEARTVRYALLDDWMAARGLDWLLTAHHADDQLETLVMRLNRASGVGGLAGIRPRRARVVRPLLAVRKAALEAHVVGRAIPFCRDPSNGDDRFDRARLRLSLAGVDWLDPVAASRSAAALGEAEAALEWSVAALAEAHLRPTDDGGLSLVRTDLPREYLRRLLARMHQMLAPNAPPPRGAQIDEAILQLSLGRKLSVGACVATGGNAWIVRRAPPRRTG